ncbi:MAG: apolipoprotein N-acyltransferase [Rhodothermales bacterium]
MWRGWLTAFGPAVASGALLGLSFPPFGLYGLAWVALVPLLGRLRESGSARRMGIEAYAAFLTSYAIAFSWPLAHALPQTAFLSLSPLLLLPMALALPFALASLVQNRLGARLGGVFFVAAYLVAEGALSRGPLAFPWSLLGHSQAEALAFNQIAEWTGVPGLTLWVLLLNVTLGGTLAASHRKRWSLLATFALLIALPFGLSRLLLDRLPAPQRHVPVGLVQPATNPLAWADVQDTTRIDDLLSLSDRLYREMAASPALILWPETALPVLPSSSEQAKVYQQLQAWADVRQVALLAGAIRPASGPGEPTAYFNSALLFQPGRPRATYDKVRLVPLAERVPFVDRLPWLERLAIPAGGVAGYRPGPPREVLHVDAPGAGTVDVGVLICFESVFGNAARRYVEQGADVLVVLTQDGWWGRTAGYRQHLAFTRLRAIETRRAVMQAAVTGTSALILPSGTSAFETGWMERTTRLADVPVYTGTTFYARHGDLITPLAFLITVVLGASALVTRKPPAKQV